MYLPLGRPGHYRHPVRLRVHCTQSNLNLGQDTRANRTRRTSRAGQTQTKPPRRARTNTDRDTNERTPDRPHIHTTLTVGERCQKTTLSASHIHAHSVTTARERERLGGHRLPARAPPRTAPSFSYANFYLIPPAPPAPPPAVTCVRPLTHDRQSPIISL